MGAWTILPGIWVWLKLGKYWTRKQSKSFQLVESMIPWTARASETTNTSACVMFHFMYQGTCDKRCPKNWLKVTCEMFSKKVKTTEIGRPSEGCLPLAMWTAITQPTEGLIRSGHTSSISDIRASGSHDFLYKTAKVPFPFLLTHQGSRPAASNLNHSS